VTNVEGPTSIVLMHGVLNGSERRGESPAGDECIHYLRNRERAEKLAAARAQTDYARRAHQELADHYARQIRQRGQD
jgi:hypothetical protein